MKKRRSTAKKKIWISKLKALFHSRGFRTSVILITSGAFLALGIWMITRFKTNTLPGWAILPPYVMVASSESDKALNIVASADGRGRVDLSIFRTDSESVASMTGIPFSDLSDIPEEELLKENSDDELHDEDSDDINEEVSDIDSSDMESVDKSSDDAYIDEPFDIWILLCAGRIEEGISWEIDKKSKTIENYQIVSNEFIKKCEANATDRKSGKEYATVFRLRFGQGFTDAVNISFDMGEKYAMYRSDGIVSPTLPSISPWYGDVIEGLDENGMPLGFYEHGLHDKWIELDDSMNLKINGERMHMPIMAISLDFKSATVLFDQDLVLEQAVPEIKDGRPLIRWIEFDHILPVLRYKDMRWERVSGFYSVIGGVLIGLAVNLLSILILSGRNSGVTHR